MGLSLLTFEPSALKKARNYFNLNDFNEEILSSLISEEEKKFKIMSGQFPGAYSLLHLQQKLIHALKALLGLISNPNISLQEIHSSLHQILNLYREIDQKISAEDRNQRFLHESQLNQMKLLEMIILADEQTSEKERQQRQFAAAEQMRKNQDRLEAQRLAFQIQMMLAAQRYASKQAARAQRIKQIIEKLIRDRILQLRKDQRMSQLESLSVSMKHQRSITSYFWPRSHEANHWHHIVLKNPSALLRPHVKTFSLQQQAKIHAYASYFGFLIESSNGANLTFVQKNAPDLQIKVSFQGNNIHIDTNSLDLNNLKLLEQLLKLFNEKPKLRSKLRSQFKI